MKSFVLFLSLASVLIRPLAAADTSDARKLIRQLNDAFVEVARSASESVVVIRVAKPPEDNSWLQRLPEEMREYFRQYEREPDGGPRLSGSGSGVIIREEGFILTNHHVIEDALEIEVRLKDGRKFMAEVQGTDPLSEIAVIKLKDFNGRLPVATFADSDRVMPGQFAIAIGTPFAFDYSVTVGHVSAKGRARVVPNGMGGERMDQDFIQTDAGINPGNSGGPLVDIEGDVIGINTLIAGLGTGIGFAVPSNLARTISDELIRTGSYERAWLGVGVLLLADHPDREVLAPGTLRGVVVSEIPPGAPARSSDLRSSDVIVAVNGNPVEDVLDLRNEVRSQPLGSTISVDVVRKGTNLTLAVTTGKLPERMAGNRPRPGRPDPETPAVLPLGITVEDVGSEAAEKLKVTADSGVVVTKVEPDSLADKEGIRPGMVITDINHQSVTSAEAFHRAANEADLRKGVLLNYLDADGNGRFTVLRE